MLHIEKHRARFLAPIALALTLSWSSAAGQGNDRGILGTETTAQHVLTGRVRLPNGAPATAAVVVTSAGGQATTRGDGGFDLYVDAPHGVESVQLTAVLGSNLVASARVALSLPSGITDAGTLVLAVQTSCEPSWLPTFGEAPGPDRWVESVAVFDDGSGPALYAGGVFDNAGAADANFIAKWDGSTWAPLGSGTNGTVLALTVFDDGSGPALYAGGRFSSAGGVAANNIAKWNGSNWAPLGSGMTGLHVFALTVFDDGGGPALYAGGEFTMAGGVAASGIAKWNGANWSPLGSGIAPFGANGPYVFSLTVFDDGSGRALYAGGRFVTAGGIAASNIAKWNGSSWSALGSGITVSGALTLGVSALAVFDEGSGPALYAGGPFTTAGGVAANNIAKWNGANWSPVGTGTNGRVGTLTVFDDGSGTALYAGGEFSIAGGVATSNIARWNGVSWATVGDGLGNGATFTSVRELTVLDDGTGPALYAGGVFTASGNVALSYVAKWSSGIWSPLGKGLIGGVRALAGFDDGSGPALYAAGSFLGVGALLTRGIAKWNGTSWSLVGSGSNGMDGTVYALAVFDDGSGPALYAGGQFTTAGGVAASNIARWDGAAWSPLGGGVNSAVLALAVFDDGSGPALFVGGSFWTAGGFAASNIARWDGATWTPLGSGIANIVACLGVFDDGSGAALFAGASGGGVRKWNGAAWAPVGGGFNRDVNALAVFDDGSGPALYAGGGFDIAGGVTAFNLAKWDGTAWSPVGGGISGWVGYPGSVRALDVFDDGSGPALYVGGLFPAANGIPANDIAKWDGTSWSPLGSGIPAIPNSSDYVHALGVFDDGNGPALYVGGTFPASPAGDSYLAKWGCALPAGARTFGTSSPGCTGALAIGVTSSPQIGNAAFVVTCTNAPPSAPAAFLAGGPLMTPVPIQGVQLWVSPIFAPIVGSDPTGHATVPLPIPASPVFAGVQFDVQLVFLGPNTPPPCPPRALSASNALEITIQP